MKFENSNVIKSRIIEEIRDNQVFLLLGHVSPDGDSLGSLVALRQILAGLGKECSAVFPDEIPTEYRFLVADKKSLRSLSGHEKWDVVFLLDIPSASRLPAPLHGETPPCARLINIDHHVGNDIKGDLNWIDPRASSVGEMLLLLFEDAGYAIDPAVAMALYTAILTDTGSFRFPNTSSSSLRAAARLVEYGAEPAHVADQLYGSHSLGKYKLLGRVLETLQTCCSGRIASMRVSKAMLQDLGVSAVDTEGLIDYPRGIQGVEVAILFKEEHGGEQVRVSLRSKRKGVEVRRVAEKLGGGGHPAAAGCIVPGPMEAVQNQVLQAVSEELARADASPSPHPTPKTLSKG